jgi:hypothetical protein
MGLTITQKRRLAALLQHQSRKVIQVARRHAHSKHLRAGFWSTLTWPWRALTAPTLVDDSTEPLVGTLPRHNESFAKTIAMSPQIHTYTELRQQIHHDPPLCTRDVISQRPPFLFTHVKRLAAIVALGCLLVGLWFAVSAYHTPGASYPYYDTQKPVPPWSEPTPLEGNRDRGGEYR